MNRTTFETITHAALAVTDIQLELTAMNYSSCELKKSLYRAADKVRGHEVFLKTWADSFFIPVGPDFRLTEPLKETLKEEAKKAKKTYVDLFSTNAEQLFSDKETAASHALDAHRVAIQAANEQLTHRYKETNDLRSALAEARMTFNTCFIAQLNRLHGTDFYPTASSPDAVAGIHITFFTTTPCKNPLSPDIFVDAKAPNEEHDELAGIIESMTI